MPQEGARPIYPPVYLATAAALMVFLHTVAPVRSLIVGPWRWLGWLPLAVGVAVALWVDLMFRRAGTTIKPFETSSALVVEGPYRISRNPIYLGMVFCLLGIAILLGSLTPFLIVPLFAWWIDRRFIRTEESMLRRTFGPAYEAYCARVRRWL